MFPLPLVPVRIEQATEGYQRFKGRTVYAKRKSDDPLLTDKIRTYEFIGVGVCATKKKGIDIYFNPADGKIYGISQVIKTRWFEISEKPLFVSIKPPNSNIPAGMVAQPKVVVVVA